MTSTNDVLIIPGEPAFKGSQFTADEYREAWGDDWHTVFMQDQNNLANLQQN